MYPHCSAVVMAVSGFSLKCLEIYAGCSRQPPRRLSPRKRWCRKLLQELAKSFSCNTNIWITQWFSSEIPSLRKGWRLKSLMPRNSVCANGWCLCVGGCLKSNGVSFDLTFSVLASAGFVRDHTERLCVAGDMSCLAEHEPDAV